MRSFVSSQCCLWPTFFIVCSFVSSSTGQTAADLSKEAIQILSKRCFACHGPDEEAREGGLALHRQDLSREPADSDQRAIVPGKPDKSHLLDRVRSDSPDERMPPDEHGEALTEHEIGILEQWIKSGAEFRKHWAYDQVVSPSLPAVVNSDWVKSPVDSFILSVLESQQQSPNPSEQPARLLRRLFLDLTGLPPTIAEQQQWLPRLSDPQGLEALVDYLLAQPSFGEHWARMWMDLARYADSQGYAQDELRSIWKYRDWVIEAFNRDLPYDQFTIEQLAGDLLPDHSDSQLIATAFHRNTLTNTEGGTNDEEFRHAAIVDRVNTTGTVWLATTIGCAQCHTHKYDPITHTEYYQLFAIFNQTEDHDQPDNRPNLATYTADQLAQRDQLQQQLAAAQQQLTISAQQQLTNAAENAESIKAEIARLERELGKITPVQTPIMRELPLDKQRSTAIAIGGSFSNRGEPVTPGIPAAWQVDENTACSNRLEFARWLVADNNPLTSRVMVNRIWEQLLGIPLVASMDDFGTQGTAPYNKPLLDWLADDFRRQGWSLKKLCKQIVMSATYQQSSKFPENISAIDPSNHRLGRAMRYRLSAEQIRDYALSVSGLLSRKMYGPPVRPPQPKLGLSAAFGGSLDWDPSPGDDRYRRGIYTLMRRTNPYPSFTALDATSRTVCTVQRIRTNTPITAFVTMNDPVFVECAQAIGRQFIATTESNAEIPPTAQLSLCFQQILCRPPTDKELDWLILFWQDQVTEYQQNLVAAADMAGISADATGAVPAADAASQLQLARQAAWTVLANALLNLDETLTRN